MVRTQDFNLAVNLTKWMKGEGKDVTLPTLDIDDFIGKSFTTGPDGDLYQLPEPTILTYIGFKKSWLTDLKLKKVSKPNTDTI